MLLWVRFAFLGLIYGVIIINVTYNMENHALPRKICEINLKVTVYFLIYVKYSQGNA